MTLVSGCVTMASVFRTVGGVTIRRTALIKVMRTSRDALQVLCRKLLHITRHSHWPLSCNTKKSKARTLHSTSTCMYEKVHARLRPIKNIKITCDYSMAIFCNCSTEGGYVNCTEHEFRCDNANCIPIGRVCNNIIDCPRAEDEIRNCSKHRP